MRVVNCGMKATFGVLLLKYFLAIEIFLLHKTVTFTILLIPIKCCSVICLINAQNVIVCQTCLDMDILITFLKGKSELTEGGALASP